MEKDSNNIKTGKKLEIGNKSTVKINPTKESLKEQIRQSLEEDREMRRLAAQERAAEKEREAKRPGVKSHTPGLHAKSIASDYANKETKSIKWHDKKTKGKYIPGMVTNEEIVNEGDFWHPDPEQDKKLSDRGAKLRAREDAAAKSKPKEDPRKLRPGESYMDFAKRHGYKSRNEAFVDPEHGEAPSGRSPLSNVSDHPNPKVRKKAVKAFKTQMSKEYGGHWKSKSSDPNVDESHVPGQPAERLGAVTAIPQSERDAARERTLAKAKEMREKNKKKIREDNEETLSFSDFIAELNRYEKETGKDYKTGKKVTKGGTMGGNDTNSQAMRHMHKVMGAGRMGAGGAIQPRGVKKEKGAPTPGPSITPAQKVAKRRAQKQAAQDMMHSPRD